MPKQTPHREEGNKQAAEYRAARIESDNPMPAGTQAQHNTKVELGGKLDMPFDRMDDNMEALQSKTDGEATTLLTTQGTGDAGGTTYAIHEGVLDQDGNVQSGTLNDISQWPTGEGGVQTDSPEWFNGPLSEPLNEYSTEHKFADNFNIPNELGRIEDDNPYLPKDDEGNALHLDNAPRLDGQREYKGLTKDEVDALGLTDQQNANWQDAVEGAGASSQWKMSGVTPDLPSAETKDLVHDDDLSGSQWMVDGILPESDPEVSRQAEDDIAALQQNIADIQEPQRPADVPLSDYVEQQQIGSDSDNAADLSGIDARNAAKLASIGGQDPAEKLAELAGIDAGDNTASARQALNDYWASAQDAPKSPDPEHDALDLDQMLTGQQESTDTQVEPGAEDAGLTADQAATEAADEAQGMSAAEAIQDTQLGLTPGQAVAEAAAEAQGVSPDEAIRDTEMGLTADETATVAAAESQGMSQGDAEQLAGLGETPDQSAAVAAAESQGMSQSDAIEQVNTQQAVSDGGGESGNGDPNFEDSNPADDGAATSSESVNYNDFGGGDWSQGDGDSTGENTSLADVDPSGGDAGSGGDSPADAESTGGDAGGGGDSSDVADSGDGDAGGGGDSSDGVDYNNFGGGDWSQPDDEGDGESFGGGDSEGADYSTTDYSSDSGGDD